MKAPTFLSVELGSPEACEHEPNVGGGGSNDVGANSEAVQLQQVAIARKFFSKRPPGISMEDYLLRLQRYCPMSTAVYLAAGVYIHKVAVEERLVRELRFDPDAWIVETEDKAGRHFLDLAKT